MKITTIAYEQLFPTGIYANQRYMAEIAIEDADDPEIAFKLAKAIVNDAFEKLNPQFQYPEVPQSPVQDITFREDEPSPNDKIQSFIATINMCTNIKFLENFRKRVEEEKNPQLTEAFEKKLQSLNPHNANK